MLSLIAAAALSLCPLAPVPRDNCVVDGDTFWLNGEKMRIAAIDTPEIRGKCDAERALAMIARRRLFDLMQLEFDVEPLGERDAYGRELVAVRLSDHYASDILIAEGLARPYRGRRESWCAHTSRK